LSQLFIMLPWVFLYSLCWDIHCLLRTDFYESTVEEKTVTGFHNDEPRIGWLFRGGANS
jgi:hypothetical protein